MKAEEFYGDVHARSIDWSQRSGEPGFAPLQDVIDAALPHLEKGGSVLDIGCQGGHQLALLQGHYDRLVGLDITSYGEMWSQFPDLDFVIHDVDAAPLPFNDESFTTVVCTNVLEHVFDVFTLTHEISRIVKPNGTVFISVPNISAWRHVISLLRGETPRTGAIERPFHPTQGWDGQHLHYFTHSELTWLFDQHRLSPLTTLTHGRYPRIKQRLPRHLSTSVDIVFKKEPKGVG